jgi:beta-lactamase regulating signal transducer with metallopeptidase domain
MNRAILTVFGVLGGSSLLLLDSAVKGTALLLLAAVAAVILRRDSAATRHLVWLLAMVAMLTVPVLSAVLPQWRVLPEWTGILPAPAVADAGTRSIATPADGAVEVQRNSEPVGAPPVRLGGPRAAAYQPAAELPSIPPSLVTPEAVPAPPARNRTWINALPLVWALGFCVLVLRLLAARLMLWNSERRATVVGSSDRPAPATRDPLVTALEAACSQLAIRRPVTLLIHPDKTIPVVWGIRRCRLLLPAAARHWGGEQLRSVLLHELAHSKRRDTFAQLLAQIACALHWFNPLVWLAAWRLAVERERACDDLVLASGVRPSVYAGHLLDVVTALSPAPWAQSCGLAMARKSSLEVRLAAVLSKNLNRRGVSLALAAIALAIAGTIAVPVAMLRAAGEKPGEKPKPPTTAMKPKDVAKLDPAAAEKLKWGEPVNGLRAAIVFRAPPGEPKAGDPPEFYVAVQNVSDAPIRLNDTLAEEQPRMLRLKTDGRIQMGLGAKDPRLGDVTLRPREVALALMYPDESKAQDGHTVGQLLADGALKDTHQTFVVHLLIEKAPPGAWTGKLVTAEVTGAAAAGQPQPKDKAGQALLDVWRHHARVNGNFPGGLVGRLGEKVREFIRNNTGDAAGDPYAKKMAPLVPRFDASRDWTPAEVVALMDDVAAVTPIPLETAREESAKLTFRRGEPLPKDLAGAPWGPAQPNGLRMAWLLEPRAAEHRLGTPLKSRILFHNSGKDTVVFRTRTWHQGGHTARDTTGAEIKVEATTWLTRAPLVAFRLWPGEFVEVSATGIGVGANRNNEDWQHTNVGSWVEAKAGDDVTVTTGPVPLGDWNEQPPKNREPGWWLDFIKAHLAQELPLPEGAEERKQLVYRAGLALFGTPLSAEEIAAFVFDREPAALDSLAKRLAKRPGLASAAGELTSGPTSFRVLPADPDAAKKPRTASGPGTYTLNAAASLVVTRRPDDERIVNEASLRFSPSDATKPPPAQPYKLNLPDGYNTWAAAWVRGGNVLWVQQKGRVLSYDFTDPAQVRETTLEEPATLEKVPKPILDALRAALDVPAAPSPAAGAPAAPATPKE